MPKDDINYKFTENGIVYDFYDVFVPAENFRQPALWVWGRNNLGQLGINNTTNISTPVTTFAGGTNWKQVACGYEKTVIIKTDGTLWGIGNGYGGRLGNFNTINIGTPVTTFAGGTNWKSPSKGYDPQSAIKTDGTLWTWGNNGDGQLGINNTANRNTPVTTFAGATTWKSVAGGSGHAAAIKTDGSLWTWGRNTDGQLGVNDTTQRNTPVTTFAGGNDWNSVNCGRFFTIAIKTNGTLWVWGNNESGQLGNFAITNRSTPVTTFAGGTTWKSVAGGFTHTAAIKTDGSLWIWGLNNKGQLGTNDTTIRSTPVTTFAGGTNWKSVDCGQSHIAAIKTDGSLWTWGGGDFGQLGTNDATQRNTPITTFAGGNNWKSVDCGDNYTAAIKYSPDP